MPQGFPLVTCLCVTRNRRQWLPLAIKYYRSQTYPNKELLIIADGESVRDLAVGDDIRLIEIESGRKIGEKRNFGCSMARGEFIAHWDDDDYSAPGRLAEQMGRLQESGKAVTAYDSMYFGNREGEWWRFEARKMAGIGTSLLYRAEWRASHPFPAKQICEDNEFVHGAGVARVLVTAPAGLFMAATIHTGNTSPRNLNGYKRVPDFAGVPGMEWPK